MLTLEFAIEKNSWKDCSIALSSVLSVPPLKKSKVFCKTIVAAFVGGYDWHPKTSFGESLLKRVRIEGNRRHLELNRMKVGDLDIERAFEMFDLADTDLYNSVEDQVISFSSAVSRVIYARRIQCWKRDGTTRVALAQDRCANEVGVCLWTVVNGVIPVNFPDLPRDQKTLFAVRPIYERALWATEAGIL